tara:strand:+ start:711 stop:2024 length:1314 start_codon:yes stop_codon:yes gene_type:complete
MLSSTKKKINSKEAKLCVIGLGYVGLPLAVEFAKAGFKVTGIDISENRVNKINKGENYIRDINDKELRSLIDSGSLKATTDYSVISEMDAISICVPTPLSKLKDPDVSYIQSSIDEIVNYIHPGLLLVLESTTYPGTTRELILPALLNSGAKVGEDLFLCFSPERIDPGNEHFNIKNTPKVIGGVTEECGNLGAELYKKITDEVIVVSSPESAEMVKLLENTFRSVNIGLVNEIAIMCEKLKVNAWEVIDAAATKPFGFMKFTPGPGLGGHCIPIDPHYLAWKMRTLDYKARFIELAGQINSAMPEHVVELIRYSLNDLAITIKNSNILLIGMAYKKDIDDVRESPSLDIMALLEEQGAMVDYYDPYISEIKWNSEIKKGYLNLSEINLDSYSAIVILTDHTNINYDKIKNSSTLIIDTRNVYENSKSKNIVRLGFG